MSAVAERAVDRALARLGVQQLEQLPREGGHVSRLLAAALARGPSQRSRSADAPEGASPG